MAALARKKARYTQPSRWKYNPKESSIFCTTKRSSTEDSAEQKDEGER